MILALHVAPAPGANLVIGGPCTLAHAIKAANTDAPSGGCPAGAGGDAITLPSGGTITLTAPLASVSTRIRIQGNGATVSRSRSAARFRILHVTSAGRLTLENVTLTGGDTTDDGGALLCAGPCNVIGSTIRNNRGGNAGGGIYARGATVTLKRSKVLANRSDLHGGGLYGDSLSSLRLTDSVVRGNESSKIFYDGSDHGVGGGIESAGAVALTRSTISGNRAGTSGGGVSVNGDAASGSIINSTISGNRAGGNIGSGGGLAVSYGGRVTVADTTVSGNTAPSGGGGILNVSGDATLRRALIAGNSSTGSGSELYVKGTTTSAGFNLVGHNGVTAAQAIHVASDVIFELAASDRTATSDGENPTPIGKILSPLAMNAPGPTRTHALPAGSPAIDRGGDSCPSRDQRRVARPQDGDGNGTSRCDIGAYERTDGATSAGSDRKR